MDALNTHPDHHAPPAPPTPAAPKRRSRHLLVGLSTLVLLGLLVVAISRVFGLVPGLARTTGTIPPKTSQRSAAAGLDLSSFHLNSISMVSASEGWAVGDRPRNTKNPDPISGEPDLNAVEPVILHYQNGRWSLDTLPPALSANPNHLDMTLSSISMVSATEGWAIGSTLLPAYRNTIVDGITVGILLHYIGGTWIQVENTAILSGQAQIFGFSSIFMRSASDGWMVGSGSVPQQAGQPELLLHYDGHAWTPVSDPFPSLALQQVVEAPDGEVWMTGIDTSKPGFDGDDAAALVHYDGSRWAREPDDLANDRLMDLTMVSANDGWAVGYTPNGTGPHPAGPQKGLIAHYQQGTWTTQSTIAGPASDTFFSLAAVAMVSGNEGWAVGNEGTIVHFQDGVWSQVRSPTDKNLVRVTMVSPTEGWAVGAGIILHYQSGTWSIAQS